MTTERPVDPLEVKRLREEIEAGIGAGLDRARIGFGGGELVLEREADGHYTIGAPGRERGRVFVGAASIPEGYPAGLPHIANETVTWTRTEAGWSLTWLSPTGAESILGQLHDYCLDSGWVLASETRFGVPKVLQRMYRRGMQHRFVASSCGILALIHQSGESW